MAFLKTSKANINYTTFGESGDWVTLVNGFTRTQQDFVLLSRSFVAKGYRVLVFDNRGAGETTSSADFTIEQMAGDIKGLWDYLKIEKSHLIGISLGGAISLVASCLFGLHVKSLTTVSTPFWGQELDFQLFLKGGETEEDVLKKIEKYVSHDYYIKYQFLVEIFSKQVIKYLTDPLKQPGFIRQREVLRSFNAETYLKDLKVPLLLLHGANDAIVPTDFSRRVHSKIPASEIEIFEGVGHLLLLEDSKKLVDSLLNFIKKH